MTNKTKTIIGVVGGVIVLGSIGSAMGGNSDKTSSPGSNTSIVSTVSSAGSETIEEGSSSATLELPDEQTYKLNTGEILDINENGDVLIIKAKINSLLTDKQTINQNYHNAEAIIKSGGDKFKEIQYWAIADMRDGSEGKVISFTIPEDVIQGVANQSIVATQLPDLVTDLWILPGLLGTGNISTTSMETDIEPQAAPTDSTTTTSAEPQNEPPVETPPSPTVSENHFNDYNNPEQQNTTEYVLNTGTHKIHFATCNDVKRIAAENYATTTDFDWAISNGYTSCGHCHAR